MESSGQAVVNGTPDTDNILSGVVRLTGASGCTGTLIAPNAVLTAAHCFDAFPCPPGELCPGHAFAWRTGQIFVRYDNARALPGVTPPPWVQLAISPSSVIVHPRYLAGATDTSHFDLAVVLLPKATSVLLAQPMRFSTRNPLRVPQYVPGPPALCLSNTSDPSHCNWLNQVGYIGGYGGTPNPLPTASVPRFTPYGINGGTETLPLAVSYDNAWLAHVVDGADSYPYSGDSGGPLFIEPGFFTDALDWDPDDPIITERTIIGVHSIRSTVTAISTTVHTRTTRLSASANAAFMSGFADRDGDGVLDHLDLCVFPGASNDDDDGDGVGDGCDNCPGKYNPNQRDQDADGIGDECDSCPLFHNGTTPDTDGDGIPDPCDPCPCDADPNSDVDGDGVCAIECGGGGDNCKFVYNPKQENCNRDAEIARGAEVLGDVCDPVPCPGFTPVPKVDFVEPGSPVSGSGLAVVKLDRLDFDLLGSYHRNASVAQEVPALVPDTHYRYCIHSPADGANCFGNAAAADEYLNLVTSRADEDTNTLWHRVEFPGVAPGTHDGALLYQSGTKFSKTWLWEKDFLYWKGTPWGSPWIPDPLNPGIGNLPYVIEGRFWAHASTSFGMTDFSLGTGVHALQSPGLVPHGLANHYEQTNPYSRQTQFFLLIGAQFHPFIVRDCPHCRPVPSVPDDCDICTLEAFPFEPGLLSRILVVQPGREPGVLTRTGGLSALRSPIGPALEASLEQGLVWVNQAEPSPQLGAGARAPLAVGVSADGSALVEQVFATGTRMLGLGDLRRGGPIDVLALQSAVSTEPRHDFLLVYSRSRETVYRLGGRDATGTYQGDVWVRALHAGSEWLRLALAQPLGTVLAATYSHADGTLWVLDEQPLKPAAFVQRRLLVIHPNTGAVEVVLERKSLVHSFHHHLVTDHDGSVVLALSGKVVPKHLLLGFRRDGSTTSVAASPLRAGRLEMPPVVDPSGYWIVSRPVQPKRPLSVERYDSLPLTEISIHACAPDGL